GSARRARSSRYSTVMRAAAFSAAAVARNWLIDTPSRSASSFIFLCIESGNRSFGTLMQVKAQAYFTTPLRVCSNSFHFYTLTEITQCLEAKLSELILRFH